jgi:hypothetical protein
VGCGVGAAAEFVVCVVEAKIKKEISIKITLNGKLNTALPIRTHSISDDGEVVLKTDIVPLDPSLNGKRSTEVKTWVSLIRRLSIVNENAHSTTPLAAALKSVAFN